MKVIKFIVAALCALLLFSSCSSEPDEPRRSSLKWFVVQRCAYERCAFQGTSFRNRVDIENFVEDYASSYEREFGEVLDPDRDPLVLSLRDYDSHFFKDKALIVKCFANSSELKYEVDGVYVDAETDALNIDLLTQIFSNREEYSYVVVECTHSDLKRDVFWNLDFRYYDN